MAVARMLHRADEPIRYIHTRPWCYEEDLCQARDVGTGEKLATISESLDGAAHGGNPYGSNEIDVLIGPPGRRPVSWEPDGGGTDETMEVVLTVDLGKVETIGAVFLRTILPDSPISLPRYCTIEVSADDSDTPSTWSEAKPEHPWPDSPLEDPETWSVGTYRNGHVVELPATPARHIRVTLRGCTNGFISLDAIVIHASIFGRALTVAEGMPINSLRTIRSATNGQYSPTFGDRSNGWLSTPVTMRPWNPSNSLWRGRAGHTANAVQVIDDSGTISGGTFTITIDEETTSAIAYDADNATIQSAVEALATVGSGNVAVTGSSFPTNRKTLTFGSGLASTHVPLIEIDSSSLTGGGAYVPNMSAYGRASDDDIWEIVDLGETFKIIGFDAGFFSQKYLVDEHVEFWDFGATIEVSDDYDPANPYVGTWTVVYDTSSPWYGGWIDLSGDPVDVRAIRITNKGGTYPPGATNQTEAASIAGQLGTGQGRLYSLMVIGGDPSLDTPEPIATVEVEGPRYLSVTLKDSSGRPVAEPLKPCLVPRAMSVPVYWDGTYTGGIGTDGIPGDDVANGTLAIVAAKSEIESEMVGFISAAPETKFPQTKFLFRQSCRGGVVAIIPTSQRFFLAASAEEGSNVQAYDADGAFLFSYDRRGTWAMGADDTHAFLVYHTSPDAFLTGVSVQRVVHSTTSVTSAVACSLYTGHDSTRGFKSTWPERWQSRGCTAIAVGSTYLWVADYANDRIISITKSTMVIAQATALSVPNPVGIAMDPDGSVWVAHSGDRIEKFAQDSGGLLVETPTESITGLDGVSYIDVADLGGEDGKRLVAFEWGNTDYATTGSGQDEHFTHRIREWDVNDAPEAGGAYEGMGTDYYQGDYIDDAFYFPVSIKLTSDSSLWVGDVGLYRFVKFRRSDLAVTARMLRDYGPSACIDKHSATADSHLVCSPMYGFRGRTDGETYDLNEGAFGAGYAKIEDALLPVDRRRMDDTYGICQPFSLECPDEEFRRFFMQYSRSNKVIRVYADERDRGGRIRLCAMLGTRWNGESDTEGNTDQGWMWHDEEGDGVFSAEDMTVTSSPHPYEHAYNRDAFIDERDGCLLVPALHASRLAGWSGDSDFFASPCRIPIHDWVDHGDGLFTPYWLIDDATPIFARTGNVDHFGSIFDLYSIRPLGDDRYAIRMRSSQSSNLPQWIHATGVFNKVSGSRVGMILGPPTDEQNIKKTRVGGKYIYQFESPQGTNGPSWVRISDPGRQVAIGFAAGRINDGGGSWTDNEFADDAHHLGSGRSIAYVMGNQPGYSLAWLQTGLGTERFASGSIEWPGYQAWDGTGALEIMFAENLLPPFSLSGRLGRILTGKR